jgi:hypothetical protein
MNLLGAEPSITVPPRRAPTVILTAGDMADLPGMATMAGIAAATTAVRCLHRKANRKVCRSS